MNTKTKEIARVVGHLLETNGTTGAYARTKSGSETHVFGKTACKFCLQGAVDVVGIALTGHASYEIDREIENFLGTFAIQYGLINAWDDTDKAGRKAIVEKLKNA